MNNINIVNFWWTNNYGAKLTAYALQQIIQNLNLNSELINNNPLPENLNNKKFKHFYDFQNKNLKISKFKIVHQENFEKNTNVFITGSDQVLRPIYIKNQKDTFLLDFVKPKFKKIAFSASFGIDKEEFIKESSQKTREHYKQSLSSFDFISVREKSGVEICKDLFGIDADWIIDPVFILDKSKYDDLIKDSNKEYKNKIVSYVLDKNKEYKKAYKYLSKKYGKKVVNTAYSGISTENWLASIKNCELLITDSFHGMCFAIIFNKPFICIANKKRGLTRFNSICEMINIENQCINDINEIYEKDCIFKYNYTLINKQIEKERQKGLDFLNKALNESVKETDSKKETYLKYLETKIQELEEQNNLKFQLRKKYLLLHYKLPIFVQKIIDKFLLKIKNTRGKDANRK